MKRLLLVFSVWMCFWGVAVAQTPSPGADEGPRQLWQLLDYVAVDYGGAVAKGAVVSESEYAEMRDFTANAVNQARSLPTHASKDAVVAAATKLQEAVTNKADEADVARLAHEAEALLIAAYPIPVAPKGLPDLKRGACPVPGPMRLLSRRRGWLVMAPWLRGWTHPRSPSPTVNARAREASWPSTRSLLKAWPVRRCRAFATLPDEDRWALAFFAGTLSYDSSMRERGEQLWKQDPAARKAFPDLAAVTTTTEAAAAGKIASEAARDITAFLRSQPEAASAAANAGGLTLSRTRLDESLAAIRKGDKPSATRLALSAYLDGFEPLEPSLGARNKALLTEVENGMLAYRSAITNDTLAQTEAAAQKLDYLFAEVEKELGGQAAEPLTTFLGSLTILLREGLEALLIVVGMIAFLKKADRPDVLRYVHGGWIAALAVGGLTWGIATYFVNISGASREVTEGLSSLFAALVLLSVGLWMHQKSAAGRWQAYLKEKLSISHVEAISLGLVRPVVHRGLP